MDDKQRFPLREAYSFAADNGLAQEATDIRDMEVEWDRPYSSSVRSGRMIQLFETRGLLPAFISKAWPFGGTVQGDAERRRRLRIAEEYDAFLEGGDSSGEGDNEPTEVSALEFALEAHLRDFLAKNLDHVEPGLRLHEADGKSGVEFPVDGGRMDLLAVDKSGKFVVIELKLSQGRNKALGQLLYYMGWVDQHLGNAPCRGIIIANDISDELVIACARTNGVSLSRYRMSFSVEKVK